MKLSHTIASALVLSIGIAVSIGAETSPFTMAGLGKGAPFSGSGSGSSSSGSFTSQSGVSSDIKFCLDGTSTCTRYMQYNSSSNRFIMSATASEYFNFNRNIESGGYILLTGDGSTSGITGTGSATNVFVTHANGLCVGNGSGVDCDGAMKSGPATIGTAGTAISSSPRGTATIDFASSVLNACTTSTITVTGAVAGADVAGGVPNAADTTGSVFTMWVSATNTVTVKHCCNAGASCDPASGTFSARVFNP